MARMLPGLAFACLPLLAAAQQALEVIPLRYRTAEQVLDTLRPLVEPGGTLTGQGSQLILRVSPGNLADIRQALDAIDRPQRRLQISVRFDDALNASRRDVEVSGSVGNRATRIEGRARDSQLSFNERVDQRVQALDGGRATIFNGREASSGFAVVPRISGQQVTMEIFALHANSTAVSSTVAGRLGQWFELGTIGTGAVWVKVETLD